MAWLAGRSQSDDTANSAVAASIVADRRHRRTRGHGAGPIRRRLGSAAQPYAPPLARRKEDMMQRIEAELLIPGAGEPVRDGVVIIDGAEIAYAGPASGAPPTPGAAVRRTETVLPGLWD